jgi:hypothetical protein
MSNTRQSFATCLTMRERASTRTPTLKFTATCPLLIGVYPRIWHSVNLAELRYFMFTLRRHALQALVDCSG